MERWAPSRVPPCNMSAVLAAEGLSKVSLAVRFSSLKSISLILPQNLDKMRNGT